MSVQCGQKIVELAVGTMLTRQWLRKLEIADVYKWEVLQESPQNTEQSGADKPPGTQSTHFTHTGPGNNTLGASTFI